MEGNVRDVLGYIRGSAKMIIPVYQRNYDWQKENCERLMDDLVNLVRENKQTHFFGSIVVKPGDLSQNVVIIDGQQRLTTVTLLLLAMKNWLTRNLSREERITPNNINDTFLEDTLSRDNDKFKLVSNPRDYAAYKKLFNDEKFFIEKSTLTMNYHYFYDYLDVLPISIDELMDSLQKLQVMVVNLNSPDDDPQLIFESLNSTGVDLTDADKIRNFLLMDEEQNNQRFYFENYWEPLEERTHFQLSEFFRDYLMLKNRIYPKIGKVYENFTEYYKKNCADKKNFFDELSDFSLAYQQILECSTESKKINSILNRFNELKITIVRPFLMAILRDYNSDKIAIEDVIGIYQSLEGYVARRLITKVPSNSLSKVVGTLYSNLIKLSGDLDDEKLSLVDVFNYILLTKQNTSEFPTDEKFKNSLLSNDFYKINRNTRNYIFERLENFNHVEALNIYDGIRDNEYSVEHIMPQKLSKQWISDLGENYQEVHQLYLNSLGNLTLTGYNSQYSNRPFSIKQSMEKGFKESHFVNLNKTPAHANKWTEVEIKKRLVELVDLALNIWPYPQTSYQAPIETDEMIIFDGEQDFTNYLIKGYSLLDDEYKEVSSWKEFWLDIVKELADITPRPLQEKAVINQNKGLERFFSEEKTTNDYQKILPSLFVNTSLSNWTKFNNIKHLFKLYHIEYESLMIDAKLK